MNLIAQLKHAEDDAIAAREKVSRLRDAVFQQVERPKMLENIGRCFRYRNRYSGDDSWWLYGRIVGLGEGDSYRWVFAEKDCYGKVTIETESRRLSSDHEPITEEEFHAAVLPMFGEVSDAAGLQPPLLALR